MYLHFYKSSQTVEITTKTYLQTAQNTAISRGNTHYKQVWFSLKAELNSW
jgi:hypothetical protein